MASSNAEVVSNKDTTQPESEGESSESITETIENAHQYWAEHFNNVHKLEEEEDSKVEELQRAIAEAKAEEKKLLHEIDRYNASIAQFVATVGSPIVKDE